MPMVSSPSEVHLEGTTQVSNSTYVDIFLSLDRHCRMKQIDTAIKLDHELRLTRRRSPDMQNFEADLSMMVPRPYESILGGKTPKYDFSEVAKFFLVENWPRPGRDRIPAGRGS